MPFRAERIVLHQGVASGGAAPFLIIVLSVRKYCNLAVRLYQVYTGSTILRRDCTKCTQAVQSCREMVSSVHGQYNIAAEIVPSVHK